jgi:hypothetical protein
VATDPGGAVGRDVPTTAGDTGRDPEAGGRGTSTRGAHRAGPVHAARGAAGAAADMGHARVGEPRWVPSGALGASGGGASPAVSGEGDGWVVELDGEQGCDRVTHDQLRSVVKKRVADRRVWPRSDRDRKAGARTDEGLEATGAGTPHGGPWSPWRANLRRDGRDQAWERRGHRCVRDADECTIDVTSGRAGQRVRARGTRFVERRLQWAVHAAKRAVDRP